MSVQTYYPEMGEAKPKADIEATLSVYGKHYYLKTKLALDVGRSVKLVDTFQRNGETWNRYRVTAAAFEKIQKTHSVSYEMLLD